MGSIAELDTAMPSAVTDPLGERPHQDALTQTKRQLIGLRNLPCVVASGTMGTLMTRRHTVRQVLNQKLDLEDALEEVKVLRGIIPICSECKRIRDDEGFWEQVESYLALGIGVSFSHSLFLP